MKPRRWGLALIAASFCSMAVAQNWQPERPIRLIAPTAAGGGADTIARLTANALAQSLGQPVVVENHPGANGNIAAGVMLRAPADGHTLLFVAASTVAITPAIYSKTPYDPNTDFRAIGTICDMSLVMVASASVTATNLSELVAQIKAKPKSIFFASSGNGSFSHMLSETLNSRIGGGMTHVPYKGEALALQDLLGNQTAAIYFGTPPPIVPLVQSGKLKALAVSTAKRLEQLPDVPTLSEQGLSGFNESFWYGVVARAGTPANIIATLSKEITAISSSPTIGQATRKLGCTPLTLNPEQFATRIKDDLTKFAGVASAIGLKLD
ncbi:MAG: Bug family tripartite tricarboxylate transporter substrate binding protein [Burkholderiaceae bacterium]